MNSLENVYSFCTLNAPSLSPYKYFHFVSRLFLLVEDDWSVQETAKLQAQFTNIEASERWRWLESYLHNPNLPADPEKQRLLQKYSSIRPFARNSFIFYFGKKIFSHDFTEDLNRHSDKESVERVFFELLREENEISVLSTYAINFLILANKQFGFVEHAALLQNLIDIMNRVYQVQDVVTRQRWLYFITHLIIAESCFYTQDLTDTAKELLLEPFNQMEKSIGNMPEEFSIDGCCEYIVCARILGKEPQHASTVYTYAVKNISSIGNYVIEPASINANTLMETFESAEHRNAVFLGAFLPNQMQLKP